MTGSKENKQREKQETKRKQLLTLLHFLCIPDNTVTHLHSVSPRQGHATLERRRGIDHGRHLRGHTSNVQMFPIDPTITE